MLAEVVSFTFAVIILRYTSGFVLLAEGDLADFVRNKVPKHLVRLASVVHFNSEPAGGTPGTRCNAGTSR